MTAPRALLFALFTVSGFAGLIYESIWTHYLKLFLGHAAYAQTLVLALFMGGMAIGAWIASRMGARWTNLLRVYAVVELVIGLAAIVFHAVFVAATDAALTQWLPAAESAGAATFLKWGLASALILPQSILLGMTFPLMSAGLLRRHPQRPGEALAMLYFTNSLGAAVGVLASGFVLIERFGLPGTVQLAGYVNIALAIVMWLVATGRDPASALPAPERTPAGSRATAPHAHLGLMLTIALFTGVASFIYEVAWIRMLSLVLGASTHSFELMLSAFILGLALGGLWIRQRIDRLAQPMTFLGIVQVVMGLAALATLPLYGTMFDVMQGVIKGLARTDSGYTMFLVVSHAIALAIMLPATFCAGMTLPLITYILLRAGDGERAIGRVYAANTFGSIIGVFAAAHIGLPMLGLKGAMVAGSLLDVCLGLALLWRFAPSLRTPAWAGALTVAAFAAVSLGVTLDLHKMASGVFRRGTLYDAKDARIVYYRDGKTTSVSMLEFTEGLSLRTNGKSDGAINMDEKGERISDEATMVMTAAIPLAIKPDAKQIAVIGMGTGLTTHTLLSSPTVERVDTIEIEPFMVEAARNFHPINANAYADPRSNIVFDDAKTYFSTQNRKYDLIISEPSNPWVSGVSSLFTREFYRLARRHLTEGGLLVQWFQLYEIDASLVGSVLVALGQEFPDYAIYAATDSDLLIVAGDTKSLAGPLSDVFQVPGLSAELRRVHQTTIGDLDARRVGGKRVLDPLFAGYGAPANSDYYPYLDLHASKYRFMQSTAREIIELGDEGVPVVAILENARVPRPQSLSGDDFLHRVEVARRANYARDFLLGPEAPEPREISPQFQKDLELTRMRGIDCRDPDKFDVWLLSVHQVARVVNTTLPREDAERIWAKLEEAPCFERLSEAERGWVRLYAAVAKRQIKTMADTAIALLEAKSELSRGQKQYALTAGLTGLIAQQDFDRAVKLWNAHIDEVSRLSVDLPLRLLYAQLARAGRTQSLSPVK